MRTASLRGNPAPSLGSLYATPSPQDLEVVFGAPPEVSPLVRQAVGGLRAEVLLSHLPVGQAGLASLGNNRLLLTLSSGLWLADVENQKLRLVLGVPNCSGNPLVMDDESILIARAAGVARVTKDQVTCIAGGLVGAVCLFRAADRRTALAFSNGMGIPGPPMVKPYVVCLEGSLGEQQREELDYPASCGRTAGQLLDGSYLVIGSAGVRRVPPGGTSELILDQLINPMSNPVGLIADRTSETVLIASDYGVPVSRVRAVNCVALWRVDIRNRSATRFATLNLQGSSQLASSDGAELLYSYYPAAGGTRGIVVRVQRPETA